MSLLDETLAVYVVLHSAHIDEEAVKPYLDRLVITLEARVVNASTDTQSGQPGHETIYSGSIEQLKSEPVIISHPSKDGSKGLLALWKFPVVLSRPSRLRLQSPAVVFALAAHLKTAEQLQEKTRQKEYLPSQMPSGINLLESFNADPELGFIKPRLSALRVSAVKPASPGEDLARPLKIHSPRGIRIVPPFQIRSRYLRPSSTPTDTSILASLDIETTPWANPSLTVTSVTFDLPDGIVEDLNATSNISFPMMCLPKDDLTLLYRLTRSPMEQVPIPQKSLHIGVHGTVNISDTCQPQISMIWSTTVDFVSTPTIGGSGPLANTQNARRPSTMTQHSSHDAFNAAMALTKPDALPSFETTSRHMRSLSVDGFGITITFTGPEKPTKVGEMLTWTVFVVNRSDHVRKLALLPIAKRKASSSQHRAINRPLSTARISRDGPHSRPTEDIADAILDENVLHAAQKSAALDGTGVICYSTDVRVGPLAPGACQTAEMRFMALKTGLLGLEAVRVVDLGSQPQEHVDIRELPSIIVGKTGEE